MKSCNGFLLFLIIDFAILLSVQAHGQSGFISLDCGLIPKNTIYTETVTNITYQSDADHIDSGVIGRIKDQFRQKYQEQAYTLRSFPEGQRNCYNFNLKANSKYLIRGTFLYGNYDGVNTIPRFDLHIGPNKWTTVTLDAVGKAIYEIIHVLRQDLLQVCLVKTDKTTPFISSLELRPLNNNTYVTQSGSLNAVDRRYSQRTLDPSFLRYDEDFSDRIWFPFNESNTMSLSSDLPVDTSSNSYNVPQNVANSAMIPTNSTQTLNVFWNPEEANAQFYIYMHFAEIQNLESKELREFNITFNGVVLENTVRPHNLSITTISNPTPLSSTDGYFSFTFTKTRKSTHPPLINGVEVYTVVENSLLETYHDEVSAMMNIKKTYRLTKKISWQGDPCSPQIYRWEGLGCVYLDSDQPFITSLILASSGLAGTIAPSIANLTQLRTLDLSKNDLSGEIPAFLADMKMLTLINLSGNPKLILTIPDSLQQRINNKSLTLIVDVSQIPSVEDSRKRISWVAIGDSVAGVIALLIVCRICFIIAMKNKRSEEDFSRAVSDGRSSSHSIETKDRKFTYSEILKMTNNFKRVLGKGGYGRVYYGNINTIQVAVKMLFHSAADQDYKHFKAEVELLLRVHHRHLVGIVGYCDDGDNLALVYEYMANGDLQENMSGKRGHVLTWENRMQIAMESAQGLEYLHNGSVPPMVHRDVKTTNILLNERFQAKLADFGLSRSSPVDGEPYVSTIVAGTPGYLDPEYYRTNLLSEKSDVYSFGVVLLEIITNQPVIDTTRVRSHITEWVGFMLTEGDRRNIIDPKLMENFDTNGVWRAVELAMTCVNPISSRRPSMAYVVMELNECLDSEISRKQGGMYPKDSMELCISPDSNDSPGPR